MLTEKQHLLSFFEFNIAELVIDLLEAIVVLVIDLIEVIVSKAQHLDDGAEQQDVTVCVQLQLLAVVLQWNNTGQRHTDPSADLLHLDHTRIRSE